MKQLTKDILYVTTPERAANYMYEPELKGVFFPDDVEVVSIVDIKKIDGIILPDFSVDTILIKKPYSANEYIKYDNFIEGNYIYEKWLKICEIANHLGMTYMKAEYQRVSDDTSNASIDINADSKTGLALDNKVTCNKKSETKEQRILVRHGDRCNKLTKKSYEDAVKVATEAGLFHDPFVEGLLKNRKPEKIVNKQVHYEDFVTISYNCERIINSAFKLKQIGIFDLNINIDVSAKKNESREYKISIDFGPVQVYDESNTQKE